RMRDGDDCAFNRVAKIREVAEDPALRVCHRFPTGRAGCTALVIPEPPGRLFRELGEPPPGPSAEIDLVECFINDDWPIDRGGIGGRGFEASWPGAGMHRIDGSRYPSCQHNGVVASRVGKGGAES